MKPLIWIIGALGVVAVIACLVFAFVAIWTVDQAQQGRFTASAVVSGLIACLAAFGGAVLLEVAS